MDSLNDSTVLSQIQNMDPASKLEIQQVIEEETRKAALQASTLLFLTNANYRHPQTRRHVDTY